MEDNFLKYLVAFVLILVGVLIGQGLTNFSQRDFKQECFESQQINSILLEKLSEISND